MLPLHSNRQPLRVVVGRIAEMQSLSYKVESGKRPLGLTRLTFQTTSLNDYRKITRKRMRRVMTAKLKDR